MKRWLLPFCLLLITLGGTLYYQQNRATGRSGFAAPDFNLRDLNGKSVRLSDHRGKVVFLNVWATWCPPCRMEMPSMERLHQRFRGRDFVMLAVSEDQGDAALVHQFARELGLTFSILLDTDGSLPPRYGITGYPETFVIDRNGNVIDHIIGPDDWDSDNAIRYFAALLDGASNVK